MRKNYCAAVLAILLIAGLAGCGANTENPATPDSLEPQQVTTLPGVTFTAPGQPGETTALTQTITRAGGEGLEYTFGKEGKMGVISIALPSMPSLDLVALTGQYLQKYQGSGISLTEAPSQEPGQEPSQEPVIQETIVAGKPATRARVDADNQGKSSDFELVVIVTDTHIVMVLGLEPKGGELSSAIESLAQSMTIG